MQLDAAGQKQNTAYKEPDDRQEHEAVELLAQVQPNSLATLAMWAAGRDLEQDVFLYAHRRDLARRGFIDADTGMPTAPRIGDRLHEIKKRSRTIIVVQNPPGAFVTAVVPSSFGPGGSNALFEIKLEARRASR